MKNHRLYCALLSFFLVLFLAGPAFGQNANRCIPNVVWAPLGEGLPGTPVLSTEMNGELYVLHKMGLSSSINATAGISRWDGSKWHLVTTFTMGGTLGLDVQCTVFESYNGMLFLGGSFYWFNNDRNLYGLMKWDGSKWSSARDEFLFKDVFAMKPFGDEMVAVVEFKDLTRHMMKLSAGGWEYFGDPQEPLPITQGKCSMIIQGGKIYVGGGVAGNNANGLIVLLWDANKWTRIFDFADHDLNQLFLYRNRLHASVTGGPGHTLGIMRWGGTYWSPEFQFRMETCQARFVVHSDTLYMISSLERTCDRMTEIDWSGSGGWHRMSNTNGVHTMLIKYKGSLLLGGNFTGSCGTPLRNIARLCTQEICGRITGTVYHDANGNCMQDQGEKGLAGRMVRIGPGERYAATDKEGKYFRYVENGTYSLSLQPHKYWGNTCPAPAETRQATVTDGVNANGIDLGATPVASVQDLRVSMVSDRARQGRPLAYVITYENAGTVPMNGTVHFSHDPLLTFSSAQPQQTRYSPVLAEWDFTDLGIGESRTITVWTDVPVGTPNGTNICSRVWITPRNIDVASNDDRDSVCVAVTGSYDPNDIQVTPLGIERNGVIKPRDSVLTYWVRFQNTGNDTAFRVMIADTLSPHLDISSIRLGASSHPFSFSADTSNVLVWTFSNIMLPDSGASEPNSHGFFKYSVKLRRDLPALTEIANQVHIYFDYNAPVATNTVVSVLDAPMNVERDMARQAFAIYPNPAREQITIATAMHSGATIEIRSLLGETMQRRRIDGGTEVSIDVRGLPAGNYLVVAETAQGMLARHITVIR